MTIDYNKILIGVIGCLAIYIIYQHIIINSYADKQNQFIEQKQLIDNIIRSQKILASKDDLDKISKDLDIKLSPIKEDLKNFGAEIKGINVVKVESNGYIGSFRSDVSTPKDPKEESIPKVDIEKVINSTQTIKLYEPFAEQKLYIGDASFSSWRKDPWTISMFPRKYSIVNVIGTNEDGENFVYNKFYIDVNNKRYPIKINSSQYVEEIQTSKFRFNPRAYIGVNGMVYLNDVALDFNANLSVFMFSYGKNILKPDWIFLAPGAYISFYKQNIGANIGLFGYNVGQHIPFMKNLFLGADLSVDFEKNISIGIGAKSSL